MFFFHLHSIDHYKVAVRMSVLTTQPELTEQETPKTKLDAGGDRKQDHSHHVASHATQSTPISVQPVSNITVQCDSPSQSCNQIQDVTNTRTVSDCCEEDQDVCIQMMKVDIKHNGNTMKETQTVETAVENDVPQINETENDNIEKVEDNDKENATNNLPKAAGLMEAKLNQQNKGKYRLQRLT